MHRDSSFCAKSVRYNIFTNGAPYLSIEGVHHVSAPSFCMGLSGCRVCDRAVYLTSSVE